jgi:golgi to ER traffic protein 4
LRLSPHPSVTLNIEPSHRHLQNGNILAAHTFITHFASHLTSRPDFSQPLAIPVTDTTTLQLTADPMVNFAQLAVLTCQRAQGNKKKEPREAWVRLCGTYQSKSDVLADANVRKALNELAQLYFAIPVPKTQPANPMAEMLSSLFGGAPDGAQSRRTLRPATPTASLD